MTVSPPTHQFLAPAPPPPAGPVRRRRSIARWLLLGLIASAPFAFSAGTILPNSLAGRTHRIVDDRAFSIVGWEVTTLAGRLGEAIGGRPAGDAADSQGVRDYFAQVDRLNRPRGRSAEPRAMRPAGWANELARLDAELAGIEADRAAREPAVRSILERQFAAVIADLGLRDRLIAVEPRAGFPPIGVRVTPGLAFTFTRLPLALSIGPRDRIAIRYSTLLEPDLSIADQERLEADLDAALGQNSIVTPIGGFAGYPSLVPNTIGLRPAIETIAHEWIHHALAFRPLGWNYFGSYEMRTLNETVADLAGREIAEAVRQRYYPELAPYRPRTAAPTPDDDTTFAGAMRRIRRTTEDLLAAGDLAAVDHYLAAERRQLADRGFYLRKLNTTYLAFFGAYSDAGNPFEAGLRRLRAGQPSLAAFLDAIGSAGDPESARRLIDAA